jgi:hypothetical protein
MVVAHAKMYLPREKTRKWKKFRHKRQLLRMWPLHHNLPHWSFKISSIKLSSEITCYLRSIFLTITSYTLKSVFVFLKIFSDGMKNYVAT